MLRHCFQGQRRTCHLCAALYFHQAYAGLHRTAPPPVLHFIGKKLAKLQLPAGLKITSRAAPQQGGNQGLLLPCKRPKQKTHHSRAPSDSKLNLTKSQNKDDIRLGNISRMKLYLEGKVFPGFLLLFFNQLVVKPSQDKGTIYGLIPANPVSERRNQKWSPPSHYLIVVHFQVILSVKSATNFH